jgi:4-amino-4-deoxy-L-arabinose transferase-like glycosyltransferase
MTAKHPSQNLDTIHAWAFFVLALIVLAAGIGLRDPWPADEPRFTLAARQMLESGQWWFTQRGNELYSDKPPMFMWLQALLLGATGSMRISFLLPSLISAMGVLWLVYDLSKKLHGARAALIATATLLVTVQFTYQMKRAQIDPLLLLFCTISAYGFLRYALLGPQRSWYYIGWLFAGIGIMTKGVGFLPLLMLLALWPLRRMQFNGLSDPGATYGVKSALLGFLLMLTPIALWLVPMAMQAYLGSDLDMRAYADDLLFRQTGQRLVNAWHHHQPPYYFLEVIATTWLPLALALPWLVPRWLKAWRARDAQVWLPLAGSLLIVLFFTLSTGKRDMYILPALPLMIWAAAPFLPELIERPGLRRLSFGLALALPSLLLLAGLAALFGEPKFELRLESERGLASSIDHAWIGLSAVGASGMLSALWFWRRGPQALFAAFCAVWIGYGFVLTPLLDGANSARDLMQKVRLQIGENADWAMLGWREQHLLQAQGTKPVLFGFKRAESLQNADALTWLRADPNRWLFVARERLMHCVSANHPLTPFAVSNRKEWLLIRRDSLPINCPAVAIAHLNQKIQ